MSSHITCISGVSCGGKTTVLKDLHGTTSPENKKLIVMTSDVTRSLRSENESFRRHVSLEEHTARTSNGEYVQTITYGQNYYSIRRCDVDVAISEGAHVLVDCIPDGVRQFKEHYPTTRAVFIYATPDDLYKRHLKRGTPIEEMRWRLKNASVELRTALESGYYDLFIHNVSLEDTERRVIDFLDGKTVDSDSVDLAAFSRDLHAILTVMDRQCEVKTKYKKSVAYRWHQLLSEIADIADKNSVGYWFDQTDVISFENKTLHLKRAKRYQHLEVERTVIELLKEAAVMVFGFHIQVVLHYEQDADGKESYTFG